MRFACVLAGASLVASEAQDDEQATFIAELFEEHAMEYAKLDARRLYATDADLVWTNEAKQWHQNAARTMDHRFRTFAKLETVARNAKRAGVSILMLVGPSKLDACPGSWYGGLQLCDHINGTSPAADGTPEQWRALAQELYPMRLMWWANMNYWSVQGPVWSQAKTDQSSDVGDWFSWNASASDGCYGDNPDGAQGGWGSDGEFSGTKSGLASWGSASYADYLVDALANSWTKNLGIEGYCVDCLWCYQPNSDGCPSGMLRSNGDAEVAWSKIIKRVRQQQPQVVLSAEDYSSWRKVIRTDSDVGGQGWQSYHDEMQRAILHGDVSGLERTASSSGADAATVLCYMNPHYDGKQPGGCPTMYFRDNSPTLTNVRQHEMWVALEAASGIISQHDYDGTNWWSPKPDPFDGEESPLSAFMKYRALNRLALRTKLPVSGNRKALAYLKHDSMGPYGDACIMLFNPGKAGRVTVDLSMLPATLVGDGASVVPYNLLGKDFLNQTGVPALSKSWSIDLAAGEMKFFAGFSLGVFAPRRGKKGSCRADDQYSKQATATTLQGCFLECLKDDRCANILVDYVDIVWTEAPPAMSCTLLGPVAQPDASCEEGKGTLVRRLPGARSCAERWGDTGELVPLAHGAPSVLPGPPCPSSDAATVAAMDDARFIV